MAPLRRRPGDPPPQYELPSDLFSVTIHHGGFFCGFGRNKSYVDGRVDHFDNVETDTWSPLWIADFLGQLGHDPSKVQVYWLLPGKGFDDGLRIIDRDEDTLMMAQVVPKFQHFKLYVDEPDLLDNINIDDVCILGSPPLPEVLSPMKPSSGPGPSYSMNNRRCSNRGKEKMHIDPESDDSSDSDFGDDLVDSDNEFNKDDDDFFEDWVDDYDEFKGRQKREGNKYENDSEYDTVELKLPASESEYETDQEKEEQKGKENEEDGKKKKKKKRVKLRPFMPEDMQAPSFHMGQVFPTVEHLRKAIQEYIVQNRVQIKYLKNDKQRLRAHCSEGCSWYLFASTDTRTSSFVVKKYMGTHTCSREWEFRVFTAKYLAARYIENFRADDKMTLKSFAALVQLDYNMTPSRSKLARARRLSLKQINGDEVRQFEMLWDFSAEVRRSNPGSTMFLSVKAGCFSQLYMSLDACKRGFMTGCRPIICVDGCHIKTKFGGQLLTSIGIDPNDCIFPIAMAVVEVEDTPTWKWFLQTLKQDLDIQNTSAWTIMSDRQKGLINAVEALFPDSQHRFCVRHLYQNFSKKFKGENLKNKLWAIARAYTMTDWRKHMDEMKELSPEGYEYLEAIDPSSWCRAYFNEFPKTDLLLNNTCEVFNKYILDARELPILSMLERIKNQLMSRFYNKNKECEDWCGIICPKIRKLLDKQANMANNCFSLPAGRGIFQVTGLTGEYTVDLNKNECTCRSWQLRGIPCRHAISCLRHERIKPEDKVHTAYSITSFKQAYGQLIMPCRDKKEWEPVNAAKLKPPVYTKIVGRPKKKRRQHPVEEEGGSRMSRHVTIQHCSICNSAEHNRRKCPHKGNQTESLPDTVPKEVPQKKRKKLVGSEEKCSSCPGFWSLY